MTVGSIHGSYPGHYAVRQMQEAHDEYLTGLADMQKAISDMRKDQILQRYQYFVGSVE